MIYWELFAKRFVMKGIEGPANRNEAPQTTVEDLETRPWADFEGHKLAADTELQQRSGFALEAVPDAEKIEALKEVMEALAVVDPDTGLPKENGNRHVVEALAAQCYADEQTLKEEADTAAAAHHQAGLDAFEETHGVRMTPSNYSGGAKNDYRAPGTAVA